MEVAEADVQLNNLNAAFRELEQFTRMGQSTDLLATSVDFAPLLKHKHFVRIQDAMNANRSPISTGSIDFELSDAGLLTEDVDYDSTTQRFFVTSMREKKIVVVEAGGVSTDFAKAPDGWPMLAITVDTSH